MIHFKFLLSSAIFLCSVFSFAQKSEGISWDASKPLVWDNFKAKAVNSSPYKAQTTTLMSYELKPNDKNEMAITINMIFVLNQSWVKKKFKFDALLRHEQCHFDIAELYARIFMKRLMNAGLTRTIGLNKNVVKIFNQVNKEKNGFQELYDNESEHSANEAGQREWETKVGQLLIEYADYSKRELTIKPN